MKQEGWMTPLIISLLNWEMDREKHDTAQQSLEQSLLQLQATKPMGCSINIQNHKLNMSLNQPVKENSVILGCTNWVQVRRHKATFLL